MTPLEKYRAGVRVTLIDKLRTISDLAELEGFADQLRQSGQDVTKEEWAMIARMKIELQGGKVG